MKSRSKDTIDSITIAALFAKAGIAGVKDVGAARRGRIQRHLRGHRRRPRLCDQDRAFGSGAHARL
ncbi:MAG: hypothetical protein MZU97_06475 [Bacillus subtilis]|nr:hypothetical protein [Bacillus subtilis]